jgi:CheY-like chemotaxis protein
MNQLKSSSKLHHIALIDDDQDDCEIFGDALHEFDGQLKLSCLSENERLISFLEEKKPDLIFLDVNMPRKNGYECLREIRSTPTFQRTPVIMYSNTGRKEDVEKAYSIGANLFLRKPATFGGLVEALQRVVIQNWEKSPQVHEQFYANGLVQRIG